MKKLLSKIWNNVDYSDVTETTTPSDKSNNIKVSFMLSPLDVPSAWRAHKTDENTAVIEFKYYSAAEPTRNLNGGRGVTVQVGKNSKRIYAIALDIPTFLSSRSAQPVEVDIALGTATQRTMDQLDSEGKIKASNAKAISNIFKPCFASQPAM